jgi:FMN phosphatase YigB (HAD superfamily)
MPRKIIDTLILDLDNTIFDWFAVWYASFNPIYKGVLAVTGRPAAEIEADIRKVHQERRTSEYSFLIEEMEALKDLRAAGDIRDRFKDALEEARHGRDQYVKLYLIGPKLMFSEKNQ